MSRQKRIRDLRRRPKSGVQNFINTKEVSANVTTTVVAQGEKATPHIQQRKRAA